MTATGKQRYEDQIQKLLDDRTLAIRSKNVCDSTANLAPNVLSFDVINPLQYVGSDSSRKRAEEWFSNFDGPIDYEIRNLSISAGDEVAFAHGLSHVNGATINGGQLDMYFRTTFCFRKIGDHWLITHEHNSVPFNTQNGKASLDLKP
jgi:ketosteroid isomerase-like protein